VSSLFSPQYRISSQSASGARNSVTFLDGNEVREDYP